MAALIEALEEDGPAGAIPVCREAAPTIARAVGEEYGLRIDRTSHRLRNPGNAPPPWITDLTAAEERVYRGPEGRLGVTFPMVTKKMCLTCHGAPGQLEEEVTLRLSELYPGDRARGFAEGDLRGLIWLEIPPAVK